MIGSRSVSGTEQGGVEEDDDYKNRFQYYALDEYPENVAGLQGHLDAFYLARQDDVAGDDHGVDNGWPDKIGGSGQFLECHGCVV